MEMMQQYPWPTFSEAEIEAATNVLRSGKVNYWTGPHGRAFEEEFAAHFGGNHAVAVANGTVALELALRAIDAGPGDEVIVTPRSFIASASAVRNVGATPVFVDVDINTQNITAREIQPAITPRTKAIICVHLAGLPCAMEPIMALAGAHDILVIEDCAQAHGATLGSQYVGTLGHIACFSFCQDKIMTTGGEGGMVMTHHQSLYEKVWSYKDHGKSYAKLHEKTTSQSFRYVHDSIGTNFRMTEMQAAIGRQQLNALPHWLKRRRENAQILQDTLQSLSVLRFPFSSVPHKHAYYKFYCFLQGEMEDQQGAVISTLREKGVPVFQGACPAIYREEAFTPHNHRITQNCPNAEFLGKTALMFPVHPTIPAKTMATMANTVYQVLANWQAPA